MCTEGCVNDVANAAKRLPSSTQMRGPPLHASAINHNIEQMMQFDLNEMVDFSFQMARFDGSLSMNWLLMMHLCPRAFSRRAFVRAISNRKYGKKSKEYSSSWKPINWEFFFFSTVFLCSMNHA